MANNGKNDEILEMFSVDDVEIVNGTRKYCEDDSEDDCEETYKSKVCFRKFYVSSELQNFRMLPCCKKDLRH